MKKIILNENDIRRMVNEAVTKVLNEGSFWKFNEFDSLPEEAIEAAVEVLPEGFDIENLDQMSYKELYDLDRYLIKHRYAKIGRWMQENPAIKMIRDEIEKAGAEMEKNAEVKNLGWANGWKTDGKEEQILQKVQDMVKAGKALRGAFGSHCGGYGRCVSNNQYTILDDGGNPKMIIAYSVDSSD